MKSPRGSGLLFAIQIGSTFLSTQGRTKRGNRAIDKTRTSRRIIVGGGAPYAGKGITFPVAIHLPYVSIPMGNDSLHISIDLIRDLVLRSVAYHYQAIRTRKRVNADPPYRTDLINAAMGARRLTNKVVAKRAGVGVMTVSKIRNGDPGVGYMTLKKVVEALGLTLAEVARPTGAPSRK